MRCLIGVEFEHGILSLLDRKLLVRFHKIVACCGANFLFCSTYIVVRFDIYLIAVN